MERFVFSAIYDVVPQVRWKRNKMKCWLSHSIVKLIQLKCLYYKKMESNPEAYSTKYKCLCNQVWSATRKDYCAYLESITNDLCHNQKHFWNLINQVKSCSDLRPIPTIHHSSDFISSDSGKASSFDDYFASVFTKEDFSN